LIYWSNWFARIIMMRSLALLCPYFEYHKHICSYLWWNESLCVEKMIA
jgi:hypothetical protein